MDGLGLLDVATRDGREKRLARVRGTHVASGTEVAGYEIHIGRDRGRRTGAALRAVEGRPEGAVSADGRVMGTYLHGLFAADGFRAAFLAGLGARASGVAYGAAVEAALDGAGGARRGASGRGRAVRDGGRISLSRRRSRAMRAAPDTGAGRDR